MCPSGKYGELCSNNCDCNGGTCDISTAECDFQYTCPTQCTTCHNGVCTACHIGFHGSQCSLTCPIGCSDDGCYQNGTCYFCESSNTYGLNCNAQCSSKCMNDRCDRWTGECPLKCHSRCKLCDSNLGNCIECQQSNQYGNDCQFYCSAGCLNTTCNQTTGECFSCINGYWGPFCNDSCNTVCSSSKCDREFGRCIECVNQTLYGDYCETPCSDNCIDRQCDRSGDCMSGCVTNQYSQSCQLKCSETCKANTTGNRCDDLVLCLGVCVQDYTGENCATGKCLQFLKPILNCLS